MGKRCSRCGSTKDLSAFTPVATRADGFHPWCRPCRSEDGRERRQRQVGTPRVCIGCGADFLQKTSASYCRSCHSARSMESARRWKAANPEAAHLRKKATHLRKYGLTLTEYDAMLEKQGGGCAVCGSKSSGKRKLSVDHCHKTGAVRGLLCGNCNYILGHADDRPALLRSAASYLEERQ